MNLNSIVKSIRRFNNEYKRNFRSSQKKKFVDLLDYYSFVLTHRIEVNLTKIISWDEFEKVIEEMGGMDWSEHIYDSWAINGTKIVAFKNDRVSR